MSDSGEQESILARVHMRLEREGGRHGPFTAGYMPHLVVSGGTEWLGVRVVQTSGSVAPGDTAEVIFALMYYPQMDYFALRASVRFAIHEGPKVVGSGEVLDRLGKIEHQSMA